MKTKVLILYTSVGHGIKTTALNIAEKINKLDGFEVRAEDIGQVEASRFSKLVEKSYKKIMDRFGGLWGFLYRSKVVLFVMLPLRKFIASFQSRQTLELLREFQPPIVISTQAIGTGIVAYLKSKGLYRGKLVAVFSDYHLHPFWCFDEVDLYLCNLEDQAEQLKAAGVAPERIVISGLFVAEKFYEPIDKLQACQDLGLLTTMPKVLLFSGARPRMSNKEIFLQLLRSSRSFQIIAVCGNNEELKKQLEQISAPNMHPVKLYGYTDEVEKLMAAADVMVGKTGGPTMGEAVLRKLPMVLTDIAPGHETENLQFLLKNNIVEYGRIPREVTFLVEEILDGKRKKPWERLFKKIIQPDTAISLPKILERIRPENRIVNYQDQAVDRKLIES